MHICEESLPEFLGWAHHAPRWVGSICLSFLSSVISHNSLSVHLALRASGPNKRSRFMIVYLQKINRNTTTTG